MLENARAGVKLCVDVLSLHKNAAGAKLEKTTLSDGVFVNKIIIAACLLICYNNT